MGHSFDVTKRHKLDSEQRRKILPPFETLKKIGLQEGEIVADIGCGIGYFTFPASEIVGPAGLVYAMDISTEMLEDVQKKITEQGVTNIRTVQTAENDFKVEEKAVTYAFVSNVLHELNNAAGFLEETKRILAEDGKVSIVEWRKEETDFGPPVGHRIDIKDVEQLLQDLGFQDIRGMNIGENFYAVTAKKSTN